MSAEKITVPYAVLVEGKYDKIALSGIIDAPIFTTAGFGIFSDTEKQALLRKIAAEQGLVVLTDSDPAGFVIRNKLKGMLPKENVIQLIAPEIFGKEKRKKSPSKAGVLGVEGIDKEKLIALFERNGLIGEKKTPHAGKTHTKADLYAAGLCGREDSAAKRDAFCEKHDLPHGMTAGALLEAINLLGLDLEE